MLDTTRARVRSLSPERKGLLLQRVQTLIERPAVPAWSPVTPLQPNPGSPPIYFIHPMGSALFFYLPLLNYLGRHYNLYGIQGHGLYAEQQALDSIPAMASCYLAAIQAHQPHGPYHLVGYSMGGLIAFEIAQQLRCAGEQIGLLALLDSYAFTKRIPFPGQEIKDEDERLLRRLALSLDAAQARQLRRVLKPMRSPAEQLDYVIQLAKQAGRVPANYGVNDLRRMFDAYDAHLTAVETYRPQPYADQIFFFQCQDTSDTDSIPALSWHKLAPHGLVHQRVAGKHSTMMNEPHVQGLAQQLRQALRRVGVE